jgi:hypothetical protein
MASCSALEIPIGGQRSGDFKRDKSRGPCFIARSLGVAAPALSSQGSAGACL